MKTFRMVSPFVLGVLILPLPAMASMQELMEACRLKTSEEMDKKLKEHRPGVYEMSTRTPDDLCAFSSMAPGIDNSRCKSAVQELHDLLNRRKQRRADRCVEKQDLDAFNQRCSGNLSAKSCLDEGSNVRKRYQEGSRKWKGHQSKIAKAVEKVETEMLQLSRDYKDNLEAINRDRQQGLQTSPAACKVGDCNPSSAYSMLGGDGAISEISQAIQKIDNKKELSQSDLQEVQSMKHAPAAESLYLAASAKSARLEMEKDNALEDARDQVEAGNIGKVDKTSGRLSAADPAASQSEIAGATAANSATAAGGVAGVGGVPAASATADSGSGNMQVAGNAYGNGTYDPTSKAGTGEVLNGLTSPVGGNTVDNAIQDIAAADQAAAGDDKTNASSASRMPMRDSLRAKLAERLANGGNGVAAGASQAATGKVGSPEEKMKAKANPDMLMGFTPAEFSAAGGPDSFSMAQSETDAAVKEMMTEFEGTLGDEAGGGFRGVRHLASVGDRQLAPEILAEDSSDLFLRTKEFYERCQRRGCVTR
jgi:hypothetical protein